MTPLELREEPIEALSEHARISIAFMVDRILELSIGDHGLGGFVMSERKLDIPYVKDYDELDGGPKRWREQYDVSNWGLIAAHWNGERVGGAVIATKTPSVNMLERRCDLAVLWDIRVSPEFRRRGIGSALFRAAESWASSRRCRQLKVETQNINVAACNLYARHGCMLGGINRFAYNDLPGEVQLMWYKEVALAGETVS